MKKSELRQIIREEARKINENRDPKMPKKIALNLDAIVTAAYNNTYPNTGMVIVDSYSSVTLTSRYDSKGIAKADKLTFTNVELIVHGEDESRKNLVVSYGGGYWFIELYK